MRRVGSIVLPLCLFLYSSCSLAQGHTAEHRIPAGSAESCNSATTSTHTLSCTPARARAVFYAWCMTGGIAAPGKRPTAYMSGIFLIDTAPYMGANVPQPAPGTSLFPWMNQFQQYVAQTYPHTGTVSYSCDNSNTEADAQARRDPVLHTPGAFPIVDTGWKYAPNPPIAPPAAVSAAATIAPPAATAVAPPAQASVSPPAAAPASAAPARAASPQTPAASPSAAPAASQPRPAMPKPPPEKPEKEPQYVGCWAEVPSRHTAYFSATFELHAIAAQRTEFRKMVMMAYGPVGQFNCAAKPSPAEAEQQLEQWKATARAKDTIVDTGWKP